MQYSSFHPHCTTEGYVNASYLEASSLSTQDRSQTTNTKPYVCSALLRNVLTKACLGLHCWFLLASMATCFTLSQQDDHVSDHHLLKLSLPATLPHEFCAYSAFKKSRISRNLSRKFTFLWPFSTVSCVFVENEGKHAYQHTYSYWSLLLVICFLHSTKLDNRG